MALAALEAAKQEGHWLAGFASYELGYAFEERLTGLIPPQRKTPLLRFGVYEAADAAPVLRSGPAQIANLLPRWDQATYAQAFAKLHDYIGAGDIYQVNLTFPLDANVRGSSEALYAALVARQPVGYGALIDCDDMSLLCRSPELFFEVDGSGRIETRPMKGTMPRGATPQEDEANRAFLENDPKNRAENLMIVDLLRNDLGRISQIGSVSVPELYSVETFNTVHQMTSLVRGQLVQGIQIRDVFAALFPCGSITGAPKVRAMEIIRELEQWPRDAYCGSVGWIAPDGRAQFNVAIRTLMIKDERATLNVGGGIVWDSTAASEYEEALWKARFAKI